MIGSYAVYHKTKANHRVGSTNYATGKAYHIYRPKALDANGVEQWAEIFYENGILSVTVPQKFLDDAVYPVRIDPTFGYTTQGASLFNIAGTGSDLTVRVGRGFSSTESGTLDSITASLALNTGANETLDITAQLNLENTVTDSHNLIAKKETLDVTVTTTKTWNTFTTASESIEATAYVLNILGDGADMVVLGVSANIAFDSGSTGNIYTESGFGNYAALRDQSPWTEDDASNVNTYSVYATYTASGGAVPAPNPPNPPPIWFDGDALNYPPAKPERFYSLSNKR